MSREVPNEHGRLTSKKLATNSDRPIQVVFRDSNLTEVAAKGIDLEWILPQDAQEV